MKKRLPTRSLKNGCGKPSQTEPLKVTLFLQTGALRVTTTHGPRGIRRIAVALGRCADYLELAIGINSHVEVAASVHDRRRSARSTQRYGREELAFGRQHIVGSSRIDKVDVSTAIDHGRGLYRCLGGVMPLQSAVGIEGIDACRSRAGQVFATRSVDSAVSTQSHAAIGDSL